MARSLTGLYAPTWTPQEEQYLRDNWSTLPVDQIAKVLSERTPKTISAKAFRLGLAKFRRWTSEEDQFLRAHMATLTYAEIAKRLGKRSKAAVKGRIAWLELENTYNKSLKKNGWTAQEDAYLKDNWSSQSVPQLAHVLTKRTNHAIALRALKLGIVRSQQERRNLYISIGKLIDWTPQMDQVIRDNYKTMSDSELAEALNLKTQNVAKRIRTLQLHRTDAVIRANYMKGRQKLPTLWSAEDEAYLIENWASMNARQIASYLKRNTKSAIQEKARRLGLSRTQDQLDALRSSPDWYPPSLIAYHLAGHDPDLAQEILQHPSLVRVKQLQLALKRKIKKL